MGPISRYLPTDKALLSRLERLSGLGAVDASPGPESEFIGCLWGLLKVSDREHISKRISSKERLTTPGYEPSPTL